RRPAVRPAPSPSAVGAGAARRRHPALHGWAAVAGERENPPVPTWKGPLRFPSLAAVHVGTNPAPRTGALFHAADDGAVREQRGDRWAHRPVENPPRSGPHGTGIVLLHDAHER